MVALVELLGYLKYPLKLRILYHITLIVLDCSLRPALAHPALRGVSPRIALINVSTHPHIPHVYQLVQKPCHWVRGEPIVECRSECRYKPVHVLLQGGYRFLIQRLTKFLSLKQVERVVVIDCTTSTTVGGLRLNGLLFFLNEGFS